MTNEAKYWSFPITAWEATQHPDTKTLRKYQRTQTTAIFLSLNPDGVTVTIKTHQPKSSDINTATQIARNIKDGYYANFDRGELAEA